MVGQEFEVVRAGRFNNLAVWGGVRSGRNPSLLQVVLHSHEHHEKTAKLTIPNPHCLLTLPALLMPKLLLTRPLALALLARP